MMFHIGIDEAGRGPLAGPVAVGGVWARKEYPFLDVFSGVADSKVVSPTKREKIFTMLEEKTKEGDVRFHVALIGADIIDTQGIAHAVRVGVREVCEKLSGEVSHTKVYLDGLLHAPDEYTQETIIRGDATVPIISLASIAAKVVRDRVMEAHATTYPLYAFEKHKGYGTKIHQDAIQKYGLCPLHRRTFVHF